MTKISPGDFSPLFSEISPLYATSRETPNIISLRVRMCDSVDGAVLERSVEAGMNRYPYFRVRLHRRGGQWGFVGNPLPVAVSHSATGAALNSEAANYHLITFSWHEDWIVLDVSHALTDGTGAYEVLRTVLYYYCSRHYGAELSRDGIRLEGDSIPAEEYDNPALRVTEDPPGGANGASLPALNPVIASGLEGDTVKTVFSASVSEADFMRFNSDNDGSPATMAALFLSRAIAGLHPDCPNPIRISLCLNQRKALDAPLAHQSLVGGVCLEYKEKLKNYPLDMQATIYRGMVFAQTTRKHVLEGVAGNNRSIRQLLALPSDEARAVEAGKTVDAMKNIQTATVSYVGRGSFGDAEKYIRDFHLWANALYENILIEISAVNGRIIFDFSQNFSCPVYWRAFLNQLEENGIAFELQPSAPLTLPEFRLPWIM